MSNYFTLGDAVPEEVFADLLKMLKDKRIPNNFYRKNSGFGRSQTFGIVKTRNGGYAGSRMNYARPEVLMELSKVASKILPSDFRFTSIQVNDNYLSAPHKDKGNEGISAIVGFGDYSRGDLVIEEHPVNIRHQVCFFDGSLYTHETAAYDGERFSLVFFRPNCTFREVPVYSMVSFERKNCLSESLAGVTRYFNSTGRCVWASDNNIPPVKKNKPILRACI